MEASNDSCGKVISEAAKIMTNMDKKMVFSLERNNEGTSFQANGSNCANQYYQ